VGFTHARFDPLPEVVAILRALDPMKALSQLEHRRDRIERLVDDVVKGYYSGFNKSIHNYSEILRLFAEAQAEVKRVKASLIAARKHLGIHRDQSVKLQFQKNQILNHTDDILNALTECANVPTCAEALIAKGSFREAAGMIADAKRVMSDGNVRDENGMPVLHGVRALVELTGTIDAKADQLKGLLLEKISSALVAATSKRSKTKSESTSDGTGDGTLPSESEEEGSPSPSPSVSPTASPVASVAATPSDADGEGVFVRDGAALKELAECVCMLGEPKTFVEEVVQSLRDEEVRAKVLDHSIKQMQVHLQKGKGNAISSSQSGNATAKAEKAKPGSSGVNAGSTGSEIKFSFHLN